jgi:transcriptional regulator
MKRGIDRRKRLVTRTLARRSGKAHAASRYRHGGSDVYVPAHFNEDRVPVLHATIRRIGLGTLVTLGGDGMVASHVPMLIDPTPAPYGTLAGHVARSNPQWQMARPGSDALAIFLGPESYISPSWYPTKARTGKVVPTWNYVAIHAYGALSFFDDAARLKAHVTRLTAAHEAGRAQPWQPSDAPDDYLAGMIAGIVGFELIVTRLEGKWKMNQNRPPEDRAGVVAGLTREGGSAEVAAIVAARDDHR